RIHFAFTEAGGTEIIMGIGVIRLYPENLTVLGDRLVQLALLQEGAPEVGACHRIIRIEAEGDVVLGDCLVHLARVAEGIAEVAVGREATRADHHLRRAESGGILRPVVAVPRPENLLQLVVDPEIARVKPPPTGPGPGGAPPRPAPRSPRGSLLPGVRSAAAL